MATIALNTSKLPILAKLAKGADIIVKSTANPNAPGNTAALALFSTSQAALEAANAAYEAHRQQGLTLLAEREAALEAWLNSLTGLAGVTESVTGGEVAKILSTGFDIRSARTATQPVAQVMNVRVLFNNFPGHSVVRFNKTTHAEAYVVERSPEPITETSWTNVGTVTGTKYEGNGATPGVKYWYRVAGVNILGQGPWSEPALRPVM